MLKSTLNNVVDIHARKLREELRVCRKKAFAFLVPQKKMRSSFLACIRCIKCLLRVWHVIHMTWSPHINLSTRESHIITTLPNIHAMMTIYSGAQPGLWTGSGHRVCIQPFFRYGSLVGSAPVGSKSLVNGSAWLCWSWKHFISWKLLLIYLLLFLITLIFAFCLKVRDRFPIIMWPKFGDLNLYQSDVNYYFILFLLGLWQ